MFVIRSAPGSRSANTAINTITLPRTPPRVMSRPSSVRWRPAGPSRTSGIMSFATITSRTASRRESSAVWGRRFARLPVTSSAKSTFDSSSRERRWRESSSTAPSTRLIQGNHIYRTTRGIWLDWMAQGTRVTRNLLHDNGPREDLFLEVNHGPCVIDNNLFLSDISLLVNSQGAAFAHNLFAGRILVRVGERRLTPALEAHGTQMTGLYKNPSGDDRYYSNIFVNGGLSRYDPAVLPVSMAGNVFLKGATPSKHATNPLVRPNVDPGLKLTENDEGVFLTLSLDAADRPRCGIVTSKLLGKSYATQLPYEQPDGTPYRINTDYFGQPRNEQSPTVGPFANLGTGPVTLKVW